MRALVQVYFGFNEDRNETNVKVLGDVTGAKTDADFARCLLTVFDEDCFDSSNETFLREPIGDVAHDLLVNKRHMCNKQCGPKCCGPLLQVIELAGLYKIC